MKVSLSATNPCHLYPMAVELARLDALGCYYSGYPRWKLSDTDGVAIRTHSLRTNVVYGLHKFVPARLRPSSRRLFLWQDRGFDRWVGRHLERADFIHGMPGQCVHIFRAARRLGVRTVLNHATGPVREWVRIMEPEYARVGLRLTDFVPYDAEYFAREEEEYALADFHCAASTVVRDQLLAMGLAPERIWLVPYGADERVFHGTQPSLAVRPGAFCLREGAVGQAGSPLATQAGSLCSIVFAGLLSLRKDVKTLLDALALVRRENWRVDFYGGELPETRSDLAAYRGTVPLHFHGAVSQRALAASFRKGSVLVLPSLEEGFGLVVPQALNCGLPAIVSDRVGGKDFIRHRENGSIVPASDAPALAAELEWWAAHPRRAAGKFGWTEPARTLIALSSSAAHAIPTRP